MTRKTAFLEGRSWLKFNNLGLVLDTNLKFYTSVPNRLKLKVRKFWELIPTFVEFTGEKLVGEAFLAPLPQPPRPSWIGLKLNTLYLKVLIRDLVKSKHSNSNERLLSYISLSNICFSPLQLGHYQVEKSRFWKIYLTSYLIYNLQNFKIFK